jgi:ATP-binding cassette subfamily B protein
MKSFTFPYTWSFLKRLVLPFALVCITLLAQVALVIALPLPVRYILDKLLKLPSDAEHQIVLHGWALGTYSGYDGLVLLSSLALSIGITLTIAEWIEQVITTNMVYRVYENMRFDLFRKLFTRQQSYLDSKKKVDILGRLSGDVSNLEILFVHGIPALVRALPTMIAMLCMMFLINVKYTLFFVAFLPIFYFFTTYYTNRLRNSSKQVRRKTVTFEEETYEATSSMAIVKSLKGEQKLLTKLLERTRELTSSYKLNRNESLKLDTSVGGTQHIVRGVLIFLGSLAIFRGDISLGDFFVFMSYLASIIKPINDITKFLSKLAKCTASMDRIEEIAKELDKFPEISGDHPLKKNAFQSPLVFENVSFQHAESKRIFDDYSNTITRGGMIAVVGQSGIGKSSFGRLLNRLQDPISGAIKINGKNLRDFRLKDLRSFVRLLSQETFLVSGSVRENLLLAAPADLADAALKKALEQVNGWEFIQELPNGLDTKIGEGGIQLSGGQSKRIHLARAFLDNESEILVFDEATTGLDTHSSQIMLNSALELARQKGFVFWITHRMQEVPSCERVLYFPAMGNPIFSTHAELLENSASYRALTEQQQISPVRTKATPILPSHAEEEALA